MKHTLDQQQAHLLHELTSIADKLNQKKQIWNFLSKNTLKDGAYLYGAVGTGKTMLMEAFYNLVNVNKLMIHYQNLMKSIHEEIYRLQNDDKLKNTIIPNIAKQYANKIKVLCIDEFEIKDITDAMIIAELLKELNKAQIFIVITSNTIPTNLYKNGLQREAFLPCINRINEHFYLLHLDNHHDYRMDTIKQQSVERIIYPLNPENKLKMQRIISTIGRTAHFSKQNIEILGREVPFDKVSNNILITNFNELFTRDLGYVDYVNICQKFNVIIVENIRIITPENMNIVVRFINFVDNAYFYKVLLFMSLEAFPNKIYQGTHRSAEFKRAISRLQEMSGADYARIACKK